LPAKKSPARWRILAPGIRSRRWGIMGNYDGTKGCIFETGINFNQDATSLQYLRRKEDSLFYCQVFSNKVFVIHAQG
jgi:hypothetical protein